MEVDVLKGEGEEEEGDPFASLTKRPRPLYSDRPQAGMGVASDRVGGRDDLRQSLQRKKIRRSLKLRVGQNPRLVQERNI